MRLLSDFGLDFVKAVPSAQKRAEFSVTLVIDKVIDKLVPEEEFALFYRVLGSRNCLLFRVCPGGM